MNLDDSKLHLTNLMGAIDEWLKAQGDAARADAAWCDVAEAHSKANQVFGGDQRQSADPRYVAQREAYALVDTALDGPRDPGKLRHARSEALRNLSRW